MKQISPTTCRRSTTTTTIMTKNIISTVLLFLFLILATTLGADAQDIVSVGPFAEETALEYCKQALQLADTDSNGRIYKYEFDAAMTLLAQSEQYSYAYVSVFLPLRLAFNSNACVIGSACDPVFFTCCEGNQQYIDLSGSSEQAFLFRECASFIAVVNLLLLQAPSNTPTTSPSEGPTFRHSVGPSVSALPSHTPSRAASGTPTVTASTFPTIVPSGGPSGGPSVGPSTDPTTVPTNTPSTDPTTVPTDVPSVGPSDAPSTDPTTAPTTTPTQDPTDDPSSVPTDAPSDRPTRALSSRPSVVPTGSPVVATSLAPSTSSTPTIFPSAVVSAGPSHGPIASPSESPTVSFSPTRFGKLQLTLTYGIKISGLNATEILNNVNNTIADQLANAVTTITMRTLGQAVQGRMIPFFEPRQSNRAKMPRLYEKTAYEHEDEDTVLEGIYHHHNRESHSSDDMTRRRLAVYYGDAPVYHKAIFDDECSPSNSVYNCVIVKSVVTVFLDRSDDEDTIRNLLVQGFNDSIGDGSFLAAIQP